MHAICIYELAYTVIECSTLYNDMHFRIDELNVIKVSDFGLSEDMYCTKYFRRSKDGTASDEKVPIRWMAPECIETDKYTERTDVVGYTVTLDCSTMRGRTKAPTVRNFVRWKLSNGRRLRSVFFIDVETTLRVQQFLYCTSDGVLTGL